MNRVNIVRAIGSLIFVLGIIFLSIGIQSSHAFVEKVKEKTTGQYGKKTMRYIFGGVIALACGGALVIFSGSFRKK